MSEHLDHWLAIAQWGVATLLVSLRLGMAIIATPVFATFRVPATARAGLLLGLSLVFVPTAGEHMRALPSDGGALLVAALGEVMIGLTLALGVRATFAATELAGRMIEAQAGLAMAAFFNPATKQRDSVLGSALTMAALVMFMALDGHHALLRAFATTLDIAPLASGWNADIGVLTSCFGKTWLFGALLGGTIVLALWLVDLLLAAMVRSMPQFNILFLSFPLKLALVLVMAALLVSHLGPALVSLFGWLNDYFGGVLVSRG